MILFRLRKIVFGELHFLPLFLSMSLIDIETRITYAPETLVVQMQRFNSSFFSIRIFSCQVKACLDYLNPDDKTRDLSVNNFNDNGVRLKQLCRSQNLNISSTFFKHRLLHRYA